MDTINAIGPVTPVYDLVPEGEITIIEAPQRWGKTLAGFIRANDAWHKGRNIFTNIQFGIPHQRLEFKNIKLTDETNTESIFRGGHIFVDELNFYFDGRRSMRNLNLQFGAFLLQQKKQGCNLEGTTHSLESLDIRIKENYDKLIRTSVYPKYPAKPEWLTMEITNGPRHEYFYQKFAMRCAQYLGWYNSFVVYDPFQGMVKDEDEPTTKRGSRVQLV